MCAHDITYQRQNEACGGVGCPKCRAEVAGRVVRRLEQAAQLTAPQLDEQCASLLAQHNAEATERKARIERNGGDWFSRHGYPRDSKSQTGYGVSID